MKIFRNIIVTILLLIAILWGFSFLLSRKYFIERTILIHAPNDSVFTYVKDLEKWKLWNPWWPKDSKAIIHYEYQPSENKTRMRWNSVKTGKGDIEVITMEPYKRISYSIALEGFETRIHGEFNFVSKDGETLVKWIDEGDLGPSPLSKYYVIVIENTIGSYFEKGLHNLKRVSETGTKQQRFNGTKMQTR